MNRKTRLVLNGLLALVIFLAGAAGLLILTKSRPPLAQKKPEVVHPLVRVAEVRLTPADMIVRGEGTVTPVRESTLAAEVAGTVVYISPALAAGGEFKKGQPLLRIDPVDYRLAVTLNQAKVKEAQTLLQKTEEEAAAALYEWRNIHGAEKSAQLPPPPPLLAKEPQLEEARAKLAAARAQLSQADLDLKRTELAAPFDGRASEKYCDLGQYLKKGDKVALVYATDQAEVVVYLDDHDLSFLRVPGLTQRDGPGSLATISADFAGQVVVRQGQVLRAEGKVDQATRLVPVVVRVKDPFAQRPPLAPGMFVKIEIRGRGLGPVADLPRAALRQGNLVWVVDQTGTLHFRPVKVIAKMEDKIYVSQGLKDGDRVVVTLLKAVSDGMKVRVAPANSEERS